MCVIIQKSISTKNSQQTPKMSTIRMYSKQNCALALVKSDYCCWWRFHLNLLHARPNCWLKYLCDTLESWWSHANLIFAKMIDAVANINNERLSFMLAIRISLSTKLNNYKNKIPLSGNFSKCLKLFIGLKWEAKHKNKNKSINWQRKPMLLNLNAIRGFQMNWSGYK